MAFEAVRAVAMEEMERAIGEAVGSAINLLARAPLRHIALSLLGCIKKDERSHESCVQDSARDGYMTMLEQTVMPSIGKAILAAFQQHSLPVVEALGHSLLALSKPDLMQTVRYDLSNVVNDEAFARGYVNVQMEPQGAWERRYLRIHAGILTVASTAEEPLELSTVLRLQHASVSPQDGTPREEAQHVLTVHAPNVERVEVHAEVDAAHPEYAPHPEFAASCGTYRLLHGATSSGLPVYAHEAELHHFLKGYPRCHVNGDDSGPQLCDACQGPIIGKRFTRRVHSSLEAARSLCEADHAQLDGTERAAYICEEHPRLIKRVGFHWNVGCNDCAAAAKPAPYDGTRHIGGTRYYRAAPDHSSALSDAPSNLCIYHAYERCQARSHAPGSWEYVAFQQPLDEELRIMWGRREHAHMISWVIGFVKDIGTARGTVIASGIGAVAPNMVGERAAVRVIKGLLGVESTGAEPFALYDGLSYRARDPSTLWLRFDTQEEAHTWAVAIMEAARRQPTDSLTIEMPHDAARQTSRRGFLATIGELVGPPPATRTWRDEFMSLKRLSQHLDRVQAGEAVGDTPPAETDEPFQATMLDPPPPAASPPPPIGAPVPPSADDSAPSPSVESAPSSTIDQLIERHLHGSDGLQGCHATVEALARRGWEREAATASTLLVAWGCSGIGHALRCGSSNFAASCHALSAAMASASTQEVAPLLYRALSGEGHSLLAREAGFATLEEPDATNFRGFTCYAPLVLHSEPSALSVQGVYDRLTDGTRVLLDSDVLCIQSRPPSEDLLHTATFVSEGEGSPVFCVPPGALLQLVRVEGPPFDAVFTTWSTYAKEGSQYFMDRRSIDENGQASVVYRRMLVGSQWLFERCVGEEDGEDSDPVLLPEIPGYDPAATFTKRVFRRLLTCSITYAASAAPSRAVRAETSAMTDHRQGGQATAADAVHLWALTTKYGDSVITLEYADRAAYLRGLEPLTYDLTHAMRDEWMRDTCAWTDWAGVQYTGPEIWQYVNGAASVQQCTPGLRDQHNDGCTPEDFLRRANDRIQSQSAASSERDRLSLNEVLSLRIYTGPGYQPINSWLRRVGRLTRDEMRREACDEATSFGRTVGHIVAAIRKLAAVSTPQECSRKLYRGLRGALPASFWLPDARGLVCACDVAFMSTSLGEHTPVHYMREAAPNLLWEVCAAPEDESGYHTGAEIAFLSQFEGEQEVLFPPFTMLRVQRRSPERPRSDSREVPPSHGAPRTDAQGALAPAQIQRTASDTTAGIMETIEQSRTDLQVSFERRDGKEFERVVVVPTYTG